MVSRGALVGRFQPPHLGHLELIKYALEKVDELIIIIAAAQISHTKKNPLTAGERVLLLKTMLENGEIPASKYYLIPAQDIMDNVLWVPHLRRLTPPFSKFFGNNPFTRLLFEEAGYEIVPTPMFEREKYEASKIRSRLLSGEDIHEYVDSQVYQLLLDFDLLDRLRSIVDDDSSKDTTTDTAGSELAEMSKEN